MATTLSRSLEGRISSSGQPSQPLVRHRSWVYLVGGWPRFGDSMPINDVFFSPFFAYSLTFTDSWDIDRAWEWFYVSLLYHLFFLFPFLCSIFEHLVRSPCCLLYALFAIPHCLCWLRASLSLASPHILYFTFTHLFTCSLRPCTFII